MIDLVTNNCEILLTNLEDGMNWTAVGIYSRTECEYMVHSSNIPKGMYVMSIRDVKLDRDVNVGVVRIGLSEPVFEMSFGVIDKCLEVKHPVLGEFSPSNGVAALCQWAFKQGILDEFLVYYQGWQKVKATHTRKCHFDWFPIK
jgi:hypothetical protein